MVSLTQPACGLFRLLKLPPVPAEASLRENRRKQWGHGNLIQHGDPLEPLDNLERE